MQIETDGVHMVTEDFTPFGDERSLLNTVVHDRISHIAVHDSNVQSTSRCRRISSRVLIRGSCQRQSPLTIHPHSNRSTVKKKASPDHLLSSSQCADSQNDCELPSCNRLLLSLRFASEGFFMKERGLTWGRLPT